MFAGALEALEFMHDSGGGLDELGFSEEDRLTPAQKEDAIMGMFGNVQLPILYPIMALFLMAIALREEIDNNTVLYIWTKPISRVSIVLSKYAAALFVTVIAASASAGITSSIVFPELAGQFVIATAVAMIAYGAFFFTLSVFVGRTMAIVFGLLYGFLWEGLLSNISALTSNLSIRHYAVNFAANVIDIFNIENALTITTSLFVLLGITIVLLFLAIWRFASMEFAGES